MVKCSSDTDKAHISESSAMVIVVLLLLQYHCPPNLELHQHLSRACAGQFLVIIIFIQIKATRQTFLINTFKVKPC